jgi:hypothetical protein
MILNSDSDILGLPETADALAGQDTVRVSLHVPPQGPGFTDRTVRVIAEYAGIPLEASIRVVRPENLTLPALELEPVLTNPCQEPFREGDSLTLAIKNSNVLSSHQGLLCNWTVTGAAAAASTTTEVTIPVLPQAGTKVTVDVVMTNDLGLRTRGHYEFVSTVRLGGLAELERLVACRVAQLKQVAVFIPPWVPVEVGALGEEELAVIEEQVTQAVRGLRQTVELIGQLRVERAAIGPGTSQE